MGVTHISIDYDRFYILGHVLSNQKSNSYKISKPLRVVLGVLELTTHDCEGELYVPQAENCPTIRFRPLHAKVVSVRTAKPETEIDRKS